jgi:hypothetical protein
VDGVRKLLTRAQRRAAAAVLRFLRGLPDDRLDLLLRTPARPLIIGQIFRRIPALLDPGRASTLTTSIRWRIMAPKHSGEDVYNLVIESGRAQIVRGSDGPEPRATITLEAREFVRLATGSSNLLASYLTGRLMLSGNMVAVTKVAALIRFQELLTRS